MNNVLYGVIIGALITFILNYILERSKNRMMLKKHMYDIKREKLEEFYSLISNSQDFGFNTMSSILTRLLGGKEESDVKRLHLDFEKLTYLINMYFSDDLKFKSLIDKANEEFINGQKANEAIIFKKGDSNNDVLRKRLVAEWGKFHNTLDEIKNEIPRVYKDISA